MNVLVYLLPMALALGLTGLFAFLWSLKSGQYDDLDGAPLRILSDDDIEEGARPVSGAAQASSAPPRASAG
jgi:cbb3-type cytochrome oxidase maturation protein